MSDKVLSIDEIDGHIAKHTAGAGTKALTGLNLCAIYKVVRPILVFAKALLFFKPAWQTILQSLIDALDKTCP